METVRLDEGLLRTTVPNGLIVLTEKLPGVRSAAIGILRTHRQRARAPRADGHLPSARAHGVQGHRAPQRQGARARARGPGRQPRRLHRPRLHQLPGPRPRRRPSARRRDPDRPRRAGRSCARAISSPSATSSSRRSTASRTRPTISSSSCTPATLWPQHPYGYSILGIPDTLAALSADDLRCLHQTGYYRGNFVIAAAGNVEHAQLLTVLEREGWFEGAAPEPPRRPVAAAAAVRGVRAARGAGHRADAHRVRHRHLPAPRPPPVRARDPHQRVRRRHVEPAVPAGPRGAGAGLRGLRLQALLSVAPGSSASTSAPSRPRRTPRPTRSATSTPASPARGLPAGELADGKQQLKGQVMLSLESPGARMGRLAGFVLHADEYRPLDQMLAEIDAVSADDVGLGRGRVLRAGAADRGASRAGPVAGPLSHRASLHSSRSHAHRRAEGDQDEREPDRPGAGGRRGADGGGAHRAHRGGRAGSAAASPTRPTRRSAPRSLATADEVWQRAEMIMKVKEPIAVEWPRMRKGQVIYTYFHFAAAEDLTRAVIDFRRDRGRLRDRAAPERRAAAAHADVGGRRAGWRCRRAPSTWRRCSAGAASCWAACRAWRRARS